MLNLQYFGGFAAGQLVDAFMRCNIYNRLVNACIAKTCDWIFMSMLQFGKGATSSVLFVSYRLIRSHASQLIVQPSVWNDRR